MWLEANLEDYEVSIAVLYDSLFAIGSLVLFLLSDENH